MLRGVIIALALSCTPPFADLRGEKVGLNPGKYVVFSALLYKKYKSYLIVDASNITQMLQKQPVIIMSIPHIVVSKNQIKAKLGIFTYSYQSLQICSL